MGFGNSGYPGDRIYDLGPGGALERIFSTRWGCWEMEPKKEMSGLKKREKRKEKKKGFGVYGIDVSKCLI